MSVLTAVKDPTFPGRLRRLGLAGFCFFLAKGLLWLSLPWFAAVLFQA